MRTLRINNDQWNIFKKARYFDYKHLQKQKFNYASHEHLKFIYICTNTHRKSFFFNYLQLVCLQNGIKRKHLWNLHIFDWNVNDKKKQHTWWWLISYKHSVLIQYINTYVVVFNDFDFLSEKDVDNLVKHTVFFKSLIILGLWLLLRPSSYQKSIVQKKSV